MAKIQHILFVRILPAFDHLLACTMAISKMDRYQKKKRQKKKKKEGIYFERNKIIFLINEIRFRLSKIYNISINRINISIQQNGTIKKKFFMSPNGLHKR